MALRTVLQAMLFAQRHAGFVHSEQISFTRNKGSQRHPVIKLSDNSKERKSAWSCHEHVMATSRLSHGHVMVSWDLRRGLILIVSLDHLTPRR